MTLLQDLLALKKPVQVAESYDSSPDELQDLASELEAVAEDLLSSINILKKLVRRLPPEHRGTAETYWLPQLEIAVGGDHNWMVASHQSTLAKTIEALREEAEEMEGDDQDEDRDR